MPAFKIVNNCLPIGAYLAEFVGVEVSNHPEYGDGLKWTFAVSEGPQQGREAYRTTKTQPTPKNSCGKFLAALKGERASIDLEVDPDDFAGQTYNILVTESQNGESTRIESFTPSGDNENQF